MNNQFENGKIVVAIRAARSAIGWNQQEFADRMGVAKSTVARIETLEIAAKGDFVLRALRIFREAGVEVDISAPNGLPMLVSDLTVNNAIDSLADDGKRRSDRRVGIASLLPKDMD
jgi:transcriptional regulator with XRE-family HTH domain